MSILRILIMAANTRARAAGSSFAMPSVNALGVICQEMPHVASTAAFW
jgi:hypothetical protein